MSGGARGRRPLSIALEAGDESIANTLGRFRASILAGDEPATLRYVDRGNYDQAALRAQLRAVGFQGPVGFQCYAIRGDSKTNLQRSINAWKKLK